MCLRLTFGRKQNPPFVSALLLSPFIVVLWSESVPGQTGLTESQLPEVVYILRGLTTFKIHTDSFTAYTVVFCNSVCSKRHSLFAVSHNNV